MFIPHRMPALDYRVSSISIISSIRTLPGIIVSRIPRTTVDSSLRMGADSPAVRAMTPGLAAVLRRKDGMTPALAHAAESTTRMDEARISKGFLSCVALGVWEE